MRVIVLGLLLIILSFIADVVIYRSMKRLFLKTKKIREIWITQAILIPAFLVVIFTVTALWSIKYDTQLLIWSIFTFIALTLPKLIFLLYYLVGIFPFRKKDRIANTSATIGFIIGLTVFALMLHGAIIGRYKLSVYAEQIETARLPEAFEGLRIVQISDYHLGSLKNAPGFVKEVTEKINSLQPDLIFFTGDLVTSTTAEAKPFLESLAGMKATYGVFSVLGNHDYGDYYIWNNETEKQENFNEMFLLQKNAGWKLMNNENFIIRKGSDSIVVMGVENWGEPPFGQHGDLKKATAGINPNSFAILMTHNPVHWNEEVIPQSNIFLTLSGHTHAMQIELGGFSPASARYPFWGGLYEDNGQYLYVNRGLGYVFLPMRIGAYPEITLIELKRPD